MLQEQRCATKPYADRVRNYTRMPIRLLHIDDDARFAELVSTYLSQHDVVTQHMPDGGRGIAALEAGVFDVVLLDVMMPGIDGLDVCRRIRLKSNVPILMLTARGDETDRVVGLELGADDYLPKPVSPRELLARIRAVLRRASPDSMATELRVGNITLDIKNRDARVSGTRIDVTGVEFDLLVALARRAGRVVSREALLAEAGRDGAMVGERAVDVHVSHLRRKIGDDPNAPRLLKTVRGAGYVLVRDEGSVT
jgi:two-component system, OmpR family, response regulator